MNILGHEFECIEIFDNNKLVQNCTVIRDNKIQKDPSKTISHGEAKWYLGSNKDVFEFFGNSGFSAKCFFLKKDFISYLNGVKDEYENPTQPYFKASEMKDLWRQRFDIVSQCDDMMWCTLSHQTQLSHSGVYVNSRDENFKIFRTVCLPFLSFVRMMKLKDENNNVVFYLQLFEDFDAILNSRLRPTIYTYGTKIKKKKPKTIRIKAENKRAREGQGKYREALIEECHRCPITKINDERLLIASHIKPWSRSDEQEQIDPNNGFLLSPLFDKLFDSGFITFTDDKHIICSEWISPRNWERIGYVKNYDIIQDLPLNEERKKYLEYHRKFIFEKRRTWQKTGTRI